MNKNAILTELYVSKEFNDCISRVKPVSLQDDLKQEVAHILCEMPEQVITELYDRGKLKHYTLRIIIQQGISSTSKFADKYRTNKLVALAAVEPNSSLVERAKKEYMEDRLLQEVEGLYWYERDIIKAFLEHGSYGAVARLVGIPKTTVFYTIKRAFEKIKQSVYEHD